MHTQNPEIYTKRATLATIWRKRYRIGGRAVRTKGNFRFHCLCFRIV